MIIKYKRIKNKILIFFKCFFEKIIMYFIKLEIFMMTKFLLRFFSLTAVGGMFFSVNAMQLSSRTKVYNGLIGEKTNKSGMQLRSGTTLDENLEGLTKRRKTKYTDSDGDFENIINGMRSGLKEKMIDPMSNSMEQRNNTNLNLDREGYKNNLLKFKNEFWDFLNNEPIKDTLMEKMRSNESFFNFLGKNNEVLNSLNDVFLNALVMIVPLAIDIINDDVMNQILIKKPNVSFDLTKTVEVYHHYKENILMKKVYEAFAHPLSQEQTTQATQAMHEAFDLFVAPMLEEILTHYKNVVEEKIIF